MIEGKRIFAVIPARSGSSLVDKNLRILSGKNLIQRAVHEASKVKAIDKIIVSSDSSSYLETVSGLGVEISLRPAWAATSKSTAQEVLETISFPDSCDAIVYLQPTSPLRTSTHIQSAIEIFNSNPNCEVVSVVHASQYPHKMLRINADGLLSEAISHTGSSNSNRQEFEDLFYPNGAIYVLPRSEAGFIFSHQDRIPLIMDPLASIDIDTEEDYLLAKALLENGT